MFVQLFISTLVAIVVCCVVGQIVSSAVNKATKDKQPKEEWNYGWSSSGLYAWMHGYHGLLWNQRVCRIPEGKGKKAE